MKKVIIGLFSIYVLTACQSTVINTDDAGENENLSTQYADGNVSKKTAAAIQ